MGFKCFMIHSGLDEFPHVNEQQIRLAMQMIKAAGPVRPLLCSLRPIELRGYFSRCCLRLGHRLHVPRGARGTDEYT